MHATLTIAYLSALLKGMLEADLAGDAVLSSLGGDVQVTVTPPDRIATGAEERQQLNLFLYQVTPNTALRDHGGGSRRGDAVRVEPLLALDLHYLLTAYGGQDLQIELLLGYAVQLLSRTPGLRLDDGRWHNLSRHKRSYPAPRLPGIGSPDMSAHIAQVTITPQFLSTEEVSKLWSALQARYRPSVAYKIAIVPPAITH